MNKNLRAQGMVIFFLLCQLTLSCWCKKAFVIVPVRELEFREEQFLPLDDSEIKSILEFIDKGGIHREEGFQSNVDQEPFRKFLLFFEKEANLTYGAFMALHELQEFIDPEKPILDVIDAREKKGAYQNNRLAYRFRDFWFVLMIDQLFDEDGRPIKDSNKKFSRLIVMKVLDMKNGIK